MTEKPTILVTGYGPWAVAQNNPAAQVAARLAQEQFDCCNLVTAELDVDTNALQDNVNYLLDKHQPDGWIGLGVSRSAVVKPEMVGINWRHFGVPDVTGARLQATPIVANGPAAYNATLPCTEMVETLRANHIPAMLSFSAGTHLCNQLIYVLGHTTNERSIDLRSGFVHIPQSLENISEKCRVDENNASMDLAMSTRAIRLCVQVFAAELAA
ncbi:MAG: pyroglutamyl-peptidase I [Shimia sp.]|nr:pyroglutamyl-peptidase I [Shimia sp.]